MSEEECLQMIAERVGRLGLPPWDLISIRAVRSEGSVTTIDQFRRAGSNEDEDLPLISDLGGIIEQLAGAVSTPDKGLFTKMVLTIDRSGRYEAHYGYESLPEDLVKLMALGRLGRDFWPS